MRIGIAVALRMLWSNHCGFDSHLGYMSKRFLIESNISLIKEYESNNRPLAEVARRLNVKYDTLKKYLNILGVSYKCNPNRKGLKRPNESKPIEEILWGNSTNAKKRQILIDRGIKESKCECCGLSEWMGKPIPLELHHKDFNHYNNTLDNLQILCANCHMQAHNYCNSKLTEK